MNMAEPQETPTKKVCVIDKTTGDTPNPVKPVRTPVLDPLKLSPKARRKLNAKQRKRAKQSARDLGSRFFREADPETRKSLHVLLAIMKKARAREDDQSIRQIFRALTEGVIDAVKADEFEERVKDMQKKRKPVKSVRRKP